MSDILRSIPLEMLANYISHQYVEIYESKVSEPERSVRRVQTHDLGIVYEIIGGPRKSHLIDLKNGFMQLRTVGIKIVEAFKPDNPRLLVSEFTLNQISLANVTFQRVYPQVYPLPLITNESQRIIIDINFIFEYGYNPLGIAQLLNNYQIFDAINTDYQRIIEETGTLLENNLVVASEFKPYGLELKQETDDEQ